MPFITQGKTNWKFLLIVVILAIVVGGGIWWWQKNMPQPEAITISPQDETVNWQTYTSSKMGFSISYPSDWSIDEEEILSTGVEINIGKGKDVRVSMRSGVRYSQDLGRNYYLGEWINTERDNIIRFYGPYYTEKRFDFAGQEAVEFIFETNLSSSPYFYREIYTGRNDKVDTIFEIVIGFDSTKENIYDPIIDQMLSTFRFVEGWRKNGPLPTEISANSEFKKYISELIEVNPGLSIGEFECSKETIKVDADWIKKIDIEPEIWTFSPNGKMAITTLYGYGEPDSDLWIYNRNNDKKAELLGSCGTPCGWPIAFWLNNEQFVTFFSSEYFGADKICNAPYNICYTYNIVIYDLTKNIITSYSFPELFESHLKNPWWKEQCEKVFGTEDIFCK